MTARLSFRTNRNGVPIVSKKELDYLGEELVSDFCPEAMREPLAVDMERFVQTYLNMEQDFQYLSSGCVYLAMTVFNDTNKVPVYNPGARRAEYISARAGTVIIDKRLLEERQKHRYRFTLGHEASHGILHAGYFAYCPEQISLFDRGAVPMIRCRMAEPLDGVSKPVTQWTDGDRMEWQANRLSSAILMPRKMVYKLVTDRLADRAGALRLTDGVRPASAIFQNPNTVSLVSETFGVSKEAAMYRLRELGLIDKKADAEVLTGKRNMIDVCVD